MVATIAITAIVCVLSFFVVLLLAWRAPEMDDRGTYGLPDLIASPPIVPVETPSVEETPGMRAPMNSRLSG